MTSVETMTVTYFAYVFIIVGLFLVLSLFALLAVLLWKGLDVILDKSPVYRKRYRKE